MDMTREEAITKLDDLRDEVYNEDSDGYAYAQAIDLAIESLSAEPSGDLVSKREAIYKLLEKHNNILATCVDDYDRGVMAGLSMATDIINALPSAEQVKSKLKNPCDSLLTEDSDGDKESKSKLDLISRADAIEVVAQQWLFEAIAESPYTYEDDIGEYRKLAEELFEDVPSADRPKGKWIIRNDMPKLDNTYSIECSECGQLMFGHYNADNPNYCPHCGADMRGVKR